jgi:hypothetical protein
MKQLGFCNSSDSVIVKVESRYWASLQFKRNSRSVLLHNS